MVWKWILRVLNQIVWKMRWLHFPKKLCPIYGGHSWLGIQEFMGWPVYRAGLKLAMETDVRRPRILCYNGSEGNQIPGGQVRQVGLVCSFPTHPHTLFFKVSFIQVLRKRLVREAPEYFKGSLLAVLTGLECLWEGGTIEWASGLQGKEEEPVTIRG